MMSTYERVAAILYGCCGVEADNRWITTKPFRIGEHVYATDGKMCVRTSLPIEVEELSEGRPPAADKLAWRNCQLPRVSIWPVKMPSMPSTERCTSCRGFGLQECDLGHEHKCEGCDGTGYVTPDIFVEPVRVGTVRLWPTDVAMVQAMGAEFCIGATPMGFCGDGFEGLVVPVHHEGDTIVMRPHRVIHARSFIASVGNQTLSQV